MTPGFMVTIQKASFNLTMEASGITKAQKSMISSHYLKVLCHLCDAVQRKQPDMSTGKNWKLCHDNAPAHCTHVIKGFLAKDNMALVQQPPYSPDLAPCDFWLFPKLKTTLKGM